jgi:hypothetical protein
VKLLLKAASRDSQMIHASQSPLPTCCRAHLLLWNSRGFLRLLEESNTFKVLMYTCCRNVNHDDTPGLVSREPVDTRIRSSHSCGEFYCTLEALGRRHSCTTHGQEDAIDSLGTFVVLYSLMSRG